MKKPAWKIIFQAGFLLNLIPKSIFLQVQGNRDRALTHQFWHPFL